ncbi:nuclear pore complex protein Nup133 [Drosophila guanche]|uniref:Blast:Nuclear pore complex protein Nup133 n=1 Tax=Drosophila guanche TaxID=7266 RepID=A0A3B0K0D6_DROGU|nr:nuclear pore complex protein Nup133 [Drosophila guanche]SPP87767.1 blast:Nuclear pore complex protein Nup133 [Drosophila guanche]
MDRTMQKQLYGMARESTPGFRRVGSPAADSTRKSFFGGSPSCGPMSGGLKKTALSNSRHTLSVRSTQSIPGIRSDYNVVESFGFPLPVVVNEALTFVGAAAGSVSAKVAQNGWAWVVHGRRLLIWQYKESSKQTSPRNAKHPRRGAGLSQCRELQLPYSDLLYNSELINVFQTEGQQMASCIAVSATGDVRYWSSIAHDGNNVNLAILAGQDFVQLISLPAQQGYLAVTTTCNLVFLKVALTNGRYTLHQKIIKPATSLLGGFGKKFASMLIGMNTGGDKDPLLVGMCCERNSPEGETVVAVLSDRSIQRWSLSNKGNTESLLYEDAELVRKIREEFKQKFWNIRLPADNVELELQLLDFHIVNEKAYILAGAVNAVHAPQMCYAVAVASAQADSMLLESFTPLKFNKFYSAKTKEDCVSVRFIIGSSHIYLYTPKVVYPLLLSNAVPKAELEAEKIEFHLHDDRILCAAVCSSLPLFFSRTHGLVSITPGDFDANELHNMSSCNTPDLFSPSSFHAPDQSSLTAMTASSNNLHLFELDPEELYSDLSDEVGQLKAAFVYHLKRNDNMVKTIVGELLRTVNEPDPSGAPMDAYKLDRIVITIAEDLAEDLPIADPRWEEALSDHEGNRHALGSSRSMQIIHQLRDKILAFQHFVSFLHASCVWEKLNAIPCGSNVLKPTSFILSDISEKIVAAMALRSLQAKLPKIIEKAIDATVAMWDEKPNGSLTTQDIFYVKLCKFQSVFESLADLADSQISAQSQTTVTVAQYLNDINSIVLDTLGQVFVHREQQGHNFTPHNDRLAACENLPWTAMAGSAGVRDTLNRLIELSMRYGAQCVSETEVKQKLYQQIYELVDWVLEGRKSYLDSVRGSEKANVLQQQFEAQRSELISVLIKDRKYEYAAKLAEKYLDFQSLVLICDETNDKERLDDYTRKYEEFDFSQFAISWHLRQHRHGEVFERFKGNQLALAQFMRDHPSLGWIQLIFNGDYERAAKVLYELAQNEKEIVSRKKSMLSLAKLAAFAAPDSDLTAQVEKINADLTLIEYQSQLSHDVLESFGLDPVEQKVLKAEDIIDLYIAEENDSANEAEFGKALELLSYVEQPYDLRHKIWCAAIRRDNWIDYDPNNAMEYMQKLLFFKIIEISELMGQDSDNFLPPMEEFLESTELDELPQNKSFQYLLKLTYEYVADLLKQPDDMEV